MTNDHGKYIAIVDPFIDSARLVQAFNDRGIHCIAILSKANSIADLAAMIRVNRYEAQLFAKQLFLPDNFDRVVAELQQIDLLGIITGFEDATIAANTLRQALKLPTANPVDTVTARFDKYVTNAVAQQHGIETVTQLKINTDDVKNHRIDFKEIEFPIVIKPTQGAASFGVYICHTIEEASNALTELTIQHDCLTKKVHREFVTQEQLIGDEYVVDVVNFSGKHHLVGINRYHKEIINGRPLYQAFSWIDPHDTKAMTVIDYAFSILDAIDFNYGPAHIEVFLTNDGPRLVEVNPRVSGAAGFHNKMCKLITGYDQLDLLADLYTYGTPQTDKSLVQKELYTHATVACLCNLQEPRLLNSRAITTIQSLPSYQEIQLLHADSYPRTVDMRSLAGFVLLAHDDLQVLEKDYQHIIDIQNECLFI